MTIEDDVSSDICLDINSSPERTEESDVCRLPNLNIWSESTSKELGILDACKKSFRAAFEDNARPARNLDQNAVLNKCGKVKVLRPRYSLHVAGKTMTRHESDEQEPTSSRPAEDNPVSADLEPPSPDSPLREDDNFVSESLVSSENPLLETPSEAANENVTTQPPTQPTDSEDASAAGSRSRRNRKKSSGSWNGEQMSLNKSSCSKIVPEIEVGRMVRWKYFNAGCKYTQSSSEYCQYFENSIYPKLFGQPMKRRN